MKCLLDGKPVDGTEIDPARHRYLGMWRPPWDTFFADAENQWWDNYNSKFDGRNGAWAYEYAETHIESAFRPYRYTNSASQNSKPKDVRLRLRWEEGWFDAPQYVSIHPDSPVPIGTEGT